MMKNLVTRLLLLMTVSVSFNSCRTDEIIITTEQTQKEKIAFFERFEKDQTLSRNVSPNYAVPFGNSMLAFFKNYPEKKKELENKYGTVDLKISSQDLDLDNGRKLLMFPMLTDGMVTAVIGGIINSERDYLYFDAYQEGHPDRSYLIKTFQEYYDSEAVSKNDSNNPTDVGDVIIIVKKPQLIQPDPWDNGGGIGHDMDGGPSEYTNGEGGGGGGNTNPNTPTTNPCEKAQDGNNAANVISESSEFNDKKDIATNGITNPGPEKGYVFGKDANGNLKTGDVKTGTSSTVSLPATDPNFTVTGSVHTHTGLDSFDSFSPLDFYGMGANQQANPNYNLMFVFGATGAEYSLVITDPVKLKNFISIYKLATSIGEDNGWINGSSIEKEFIDAIRQFIRKGKTDDEAYALANAAVLKKFEMGIAISKKDSSGKFKTLFVKANNDSNNTSYDQTTDCNL